MHLCPAFLGLGFVAVLAGPVPALAASTLFRDAVLADEPLLYFQLSEPEGTAVNEGSLGVDFNADYLGTPSRAMPTESGDESVAFDAAEDFLKTDAIAPESLSGNPTFSAEALYFVPPDGTALNWAPFLHWGDLTLLPAMKSVYFGFQNDKPTRLFAGFYNGGLRTVADVPRGVWHHVVWVRNGGAAANVGTTLYVDGVAVALEDDPELPVNGSTPEIINTAFRINRSQDADRFFRGSLDELALYGRALSQEEVEAHYAALDKCAEEKCIDYDGGCKLCGFPSSGGSAPLAGDALAVLRAAVGSRKCNRCVCDVDEGGSVVATDALITLKKAVGQSVSLQCPEQDLG